MVVSDTIIPSVIGGISSLWNPHHWEQFGALTIPETLEYIGETVLSITEEAYADGYAISYSPMLFANSGASGALTRQYQASSRSLLNVYNTNGANTDYIEFTLPIGFGTWTFDIWAATNNTMGILSIQLDGTEIGTHDNFVAVASLSYNHQITLTGITVAASGNHILRLGCPTKHVDAYEYHFYLQEILATRTGE